MNKRLQTIFSEIPETQSFADVGCDHGYIAQAVLQSSKCLNVTVSDISAPSLKKAEKLLRKYINSGSARAIVCDGLELVPPCETVLIAGMGGEETVKILAAAPFKPKYLVLSPMKNQDKVRVYLQSAGYGITKDYVFYDGRFYHLICAELGVLQDKYSEKEILFGRGNLLERSEDFLAYINKELEKAQTYKTHVVSENDRAQFDNRIKLLKEILYEDNRNS